MLIHDCVRFAVDLVVCVAMGVDMFDCVFPTRTARFGTALVPWGNMALKQARYAADMRPIDEDCSCLTCRTCTRAYLHSIVTRETASCHLLSIHNIAYQMRLMKGMREAILADKYESASLDMPLNAARSRFPAYVRTFMETMFADSPYPQWAVNALGAVGILLPRSATESA